MYWFDKNLVTVWSAPNYCYRMKNEASIMMINENYETKWEKFTEVEEDDKKCEPPSKVLPYFL